MRLEARPPVRLSEDLGRKWIPPSARTLSDDHALCPVLNSNCTEVMCDTAVEVQCTKCLSGFVLMIMTLITWGLVTVWGFCVHQASQRNLGMTFSTLSFGEGIWRLEVVWELLEDLPSLFEAPVRFRWVRVQKVLDCSLTERNFVNTHRYGRSEKTVKKNDCSEVAQMQWVNHHSKIFHSVSLENNRNKNTRSSQSKI